MTLVEEYKARRIRLGFTDQRQVIAVRSPQVEELNVRIGVLEAEREIHLGRIAQLETDNREATDRLRTFVDLPDSAPKAVVKLRAIQAAVAAYFKISVDDVTSQRRLAALVYPRHIAIYLVSKLTANSLPSIGRHFNRDHTTIFYAVNKIADAIQVPGRTADDVNNLLSVLEPAS